jgi:hypothetical protein
MALHQVLVMGICLALLESGIHPRQRNAVSAPTQTNSVIAPDKHGEFNAVD